MNTNKSPAELAKLANDRIKIMDQLRKMMERGDLDPKEVRDESEKYMGVSIADPPRVAGQKLDAGKSPVWRGFIEYFPEGMQEVALVSMKGTAEPGHVWGGWKSVPDGYVRYSDAMSRHMTEEAGINIIDLTCVKEDEDYKLLQAKITACATVAWNAMARLEHLIKDFEV